MKKDSELKREIIEKCLKGENRNRICEQYGVAKSTIYYWLKQEKKLFSSHKPSIITYKQFYEMKKERDLAIRNLEMYERLHCFKDSTVREKQEAIKKLIDIYPIKSMCIMLNLPKGTFYNYYLRRTKVTQNSIRDNELKEKIMKIYLDSGKRFGAKKIEAKLRSDGINTTLHKVQTLMKLLNIQSTQKISKNELPLKDNSQYYVNKLKRVFKQNAPNKYWVSDVTELRVGKNKFYLCVILDLFSRKVIAYRLSSQNNTNLTINTFKDAYENRNRPKELSFHSDQGANYTAYDFRDLLRFLKVNQSFSKAGNPYDNACMESFYSTFKREEYNGKTYKFFEDLEQSVKSYMNYNNDYRPHQTLQNKTPNQFEEEFYKNQ